MGADGASASLQVPSTEAPWTRELERYHREKPSQVRGFCFQLADYFAANYPSLKVVHGVGSNRPMSYWLDGGEYINGATLTLHAWCMAPDGSVVDPTGQQYSRKQVWRYPLKSGRLWHRSGQRMWVQRCKGCRAPVPADYQGASCCSFNRLAWIKWVLDIHAEAVTVGGRSL